MRCSNLIANGAFSHTNCILFLCEIQIDVPLIPSIYLLRYFFTSFYRGSIVFIYLVTLLKFCNENDKRGRKQSKCMKLNLRS